MEDSSASSQGLPLEPGSSPQTSPAPATQPPAANEPLPANQPEMAATAATTIPKEAAASRSRSRTSDDRWQNRLLPLMRGMLIGLTVFFFVVSLIQMSYLHYTIQQVPPVDLGLPQGKTLIEHSAGFSDEMAARQLDILSRLEAAVLERRYHQASAAMMSGLWLRYLGFVTGMILALVGAAFILGKLREPVSEISGKGGSVDFSLRSASPGIILVVLGVVLMMATILDQDTYETAAKGIYLPEQSGLFQTYETELPLLGTYPADFSIATPEPGDGGVLGTLPP